jgi:hypothetical protein
MDTPSMGVGNVIVIGGSIYLELSLTTLAGIYGRDRTPTSRILGRGNNGR